MAQSYEYNLRRAGEIIQQILYATIATCSLDGQPWNSPVAKFNDEHLNMYWFSDKGAVHSENIRSNPQVFIVIYDSTMPEGTGEAVYIEAVAEEINDLEKIQQICKLQTGNMKVETAAVSGESIHRFYKALPKRIWINDEETDKNGAYVRDIRVEIPISEIMKQI